MTCHRRKWRWNIKRNLFVLIHIKSKCFRNLNLKSLAYFLKEEPSLYSEHLHSSFMSTLFNSSLRTLTTDPTPHHQCHQSLSKILTGPFQLSETNSLSAVSIYTSQIYPPKLLWGNHRQCLLLPKDKGNKMFSTQLREFHLSDQSDAAGWTEHFIWPPYHPLFNRKSHDFQNGNHSNCLQKVKPEMFIFGQQQKSRQF